LVYLPVLHRPYLLQEFYQYYPHRLLVYLLALDQCCPNLCHLGLPLVSLAHLLDLVWLECHQSYHHPSLDPWVLLHDLASYHRPSLLYLDLQLLDPPLLVNLVFYYHLPLEGLAKDLGA
jgi:hypothetical protein